MNLIGNLRTFVRVAQCGSFSLAATQLGIAQSATSKHVAVLERHLGVRLFNRTTRQVKLTNDGATYFGFAQRILDDLDEAESQVGRAKKAPSGLIRVGSPYFFAQYFLVEVIAKLLARYPLIEVQIIVSDGIPSLIEQGIDVAIRFGEPSGALISKRIGIASRIAVASPRYLERFGEPRTPTDLVRHQCLIYDNPMLSRAWSFRRRDEQITVSVPGRFSANSAQIIRDACLAGLGIAVMPVWLFEEHVSAGRLKRVMERYQPQELPLSLVYASRKYVPLKTRAVLDFLSAELRLKLAALSGER